VPGPRSGGLTPPTFVDHSTATIQRSGFGSRELGCTEGGSDEVMMILEAANDLGDHDTVAVCPRIIAAGWIGWSQANMQVAFRVRVERLPEELQTRCISAENLATSTATL
jgi:hypothetical protein